MKRVVSRFSTASSLESISNVSWVKSQPRDFLMWKILDEFELRKKQTAVSQKQKPSSTPFVFSSPKELRSDRVEFSSTFETLLTNCTTVDSVDELWRSRPEFHRDPVALFARSLTISLLSNSNKELSRSLGAFRRLQSFSSSSPIPPQLFTYSLNYTMSALLHNPKLVVDLLEESKQVANIKSFALAFASVLSVEFNESTGYFIEKAFSRFASNTTSSSSKDFFKSSGRISKVFQVMKERGVVVSDELIDEILLSIPNHDVPGLPQMFHNLMERKNSLAVQCLLYHTGMVQINATQCLKVLSEMQCAKTPYHYILAASGLRRRSWLDWESPHERKSPSKNAHNIKVFGKTISPFQIVALQQNYEKDFQTEILHPRFALELLKCHATHTGLEPFGTSEIPLERFIFDRLVKHNLPIDHDGSVFGYVLERIARNSKFKTALSLADYMNTLKIPRNSRTNNGFLSVSLRRMYKISESEHDAFVIDCEFLMHQAAQNTKERLPQFAKHFENKLSALSPSKGSIASRCPIQETCQVDLRTIFLLASIYKKRSKPVEDLKNVSGMLQALKLDRADVGWVKLLEDYVVQFMTINDAIKHVGELQTSGFPVDGETLHSLVSVILLGNNNNNKRFSSVSEAVGHWIGFSRSHQLKPVSKTVSLLVKHARLEKDMVEFGRIRSFCEEFGVEREWDSMFF